MSINKREKKEELLKKIENNKKISSILSQSLNRRYWGPRYDRRWNLATFKQIEYIRHLNWRLAKEYKAKKDYTSLTRAEAGRIINRLEKLVGKIDPKNPNYGAFKRTPEGQKPKTILRKKRDINT